MNIRLLTLALLLHHLHVLLHHLHVLLPHFRRHVFHVFVHDRLPLFGRFCPHHLVMHVAHGLHIHHAPLIT